MPMADLLKHFKLGPTVLTEMPVAACIFPYSHVKRLNRLL